MVSCSTWKEIEVCAGQMQSARYQLWQRLETPLEKVTSFSQVFVIPETLQMHSGTRCRPVSYLRPRQIRSLTLMEGNLKSRNTDYTEERLLLRKRFGCLWNLLSRYDLLYSHTGFMKTIQSPSDQWYHLFSEVIFQQNPIFSNRSICSCVNKHFFFCFNFLYSFLCVVTNLPKARFCL